jgi:hypothetical protein
VGLLGDLVPSLLMLVGSFSALVYLAQVSQLNGRPSADSDGHYFHLVNQVYQYAYDPWLRLAGSAILPLALVFLAPLFKDIAIALEVAVNRKALSRWSHRLSRLVTRSLEWSVENALTPVILIVAVFKREAFVNFIATSVGFLTIWLIEVVVRRRRRDICPGSSSLIFLAIALRLGKTLHSSPPVAVLQRLMMPSWQALGLAVNASLESEGEPLFPSYFKLGDPSSWAVIPGFLIAFSIVTAAAHLFERVLAWHVEANRPARIRRAQLALESDLLWFLATAVKILIWWLWRITSLTSIAICILQFCLFRQIRTLIPTAVFAAVEMGGMLVSEIQSRRAETLLNKRLVTTIDGDPLSLEPKSKASWEDLQVGTTIIVGPGMEAPGTLLLIQPLRRQGQATARSQVAVNTVSIDGETAERVKNCLLGSGESGSLLETITEAIERGSNPGLVVAEALKLHSRGYSADKHLTRHPLIVRQGARLAESASNPVTGLVIGFNRPKQSSRSNGAVDHFLARLSQRHTHLLAGFTAITVLCCWALFGVSPLGRPKLVLELALANNVCLLMTLVSISGAVLELLLTTIPGLSFGLEGKRALIALSEGFARAQARFGDGSILGVHLSDKTGTITRNEMSLQATVEPRSTVTADWHFVAPDAETAANGTLSRLHVAITTNTPESPQVVPEEAAYSRGLGVKILSIEASDSCWERIGYSWHGHAPDPVARLSLGLSPRFRAATALVRGPLLHLGKGEVGLVLQGSPELFDGTAPQLRSLRAADRVEFPSLELTQGHCRDPGAQRNWVLALASRALTCEEIRQMERAAGLLRDDPSDKVAVAIRDSVIAGQFFHPERLMVLVDRYRDGVDRVPQACANRRMSFWMVTGDGLANAAAIAKSLNLPQAAVALEALPDESITSFLERLSGALALHVADETPLTLYLGDREQTLLTGLSSASSALRERLSRVLRAVDRQQRPLVQAVCYNSERDLKQGLVNFCRRELQVATVFTGDGKNDIDALQSADLGIAFPSVTRENGDIEHDPEVYLAGTIRSDVAFWTGYNTTNSLLLTWGSILWSQLWTVSVLLILKQSGTAGINVAAAASTNFANNQDPYHPMLYLFLSNAVAFPLIVASSVLAIRHSSGRDITQGIRRLTVRPLIVWSAVAWIIGMTLFGLVQRVISNPSYQADGALILLVILIGTVGVILSRVDHGWFS